MVKVRHAYCEVHDPVEEEQAQAVDCTCRADGHAAQSPRSNVGDLGVEVQGLTLDESAAAIKDALSPSRKNSAGFGAQVICLQSRTAGNHIDSVAGTAADHVIQHAHS